MALFTYLEIFTMFPMTSNGFIKLQKELQNLISSQRPSVIEEIAKARQYGDLSENAEYHAAKEKQKRIENRIRDLEFKISNAQVVDVRGLSGPKIMFGATVVLYDEDKKEVATYQIVGVDEANISEGKIAINSALARELIGKEEGVTIELTTPRGEKIYHIQEVQYS